MPKNKIKILQLQPRYLLVMFDKADECRAINDDAFGGKKPFRVTSLPCQDLSAAAALWKKHDKGRGDD